MSDREQKLKERAATFHSFRQTDERYQRACFALYEELSVAERDELMQLAVCGPVWDGDVLSKAARDTLLYIELASRACVSGQQGYTVANYSGWDVLRSHVPRERLEEIAKAQKRWRFS